MLIPEEIGLSQFYGTIYQPVTGSKCLSWFRDVIENHQLLSTSSSIVKWRMT